MGILSKLFGGGSKATATETHEAPAVDCSHMQLVPRWGNAEDMGKAEKATEYICSACGEHFTPERAHEIRGH